VPASFLRDERPVASNLAVRAYDASDVVIPVGCVPPPTVLPFDVDARLIAWRWIGGHRTPREPKDREHTEAAKCVHELLNINSDISLDSKLILIIQKNG
jgi:hypothetical protein